MTTSRRTKRTVRARMARTGENYTTALRRHLAGEPEPRPVSDLDPPVPSRCDRCGAWGGDHTASCPLDRS